MRRAHVASGLLVIAFALAGCAAEEGSPDPTPSATPTASGSPSATGTTTATGGTTTSSASNSTSVAPRPSQTFDIAIQGNSFVDGTKTIQKGDTVRWTQKDTNQHTVTAQDGSFDSGTMLPIGPSSMFSHKFDAVGEFPYFCEVHGGMTAQISVVEALPA